MVKIGLLIALKRELPEIIPYGKSKYVQTYNIGDYNIGVLRSGIGQKRAEKATERLCTEFNPYYLIFLGFCGCVDPELNIGTLIVADTIHYNGKNESLEGLELEHVKRCLTDSSIDYRVGEFQTFDRPVLSKGEVLEGILGVDLEAYAIVRKAKEYDTPPIIIKSVSDILPEKKHLIFPTIRLVYRIFKNFKTAKKGLNDFGQNYFKSQTT
jgi:nucleoside phosphorylase